MLRSALSSARSLTCRHPVLTNTVLYGSLYTLAEVSRQRLSGRSSRNPATALDLASVKRYAIMGTLVIPPIFTRWYRWLDTRFPATSGPVLVKKLVLDQFLLTPVVIVIFFVGMAWLEGQQGDQRLAELRQKGVNTFLIDCCFWLPVQLLNFSLVPPQLRVAFIGLATFVWLNVLAYIKALPTHRE